MAGTPAGWSEIRVQAMARGTRSFESVLAVQPGRLSGGAFDPMAQRAAHAGRGIVRDRPAAGRCGLSAPSTDTDDDLFGLRSMPCGVRIPNAHRTA